MADILYAFMQKKEVTIQKNDKPCTTNTCNYQCTRYADKKPGFSTTLVRDSVLLLMIVLGAIYLYTRSKKKIYLYGGLLFVVLIIGSVVYSSFKEKQAQLCTDQNNKHSTTSQVISIADTSFRSVGDEFKHTNDEFAATDSSFVSANDTEFKSSADEFGSNKPLDTPTEVTADYTLLYTLMVLFSVTILIGVCIRYPVFRKYRGLFLLSSVVYLGFISGACPCMIMSFQNTVLAMLGNHVHWVSMLWFLGLLPLTYFFGRVWCGWLCHLGGLQEFLFQSAKLKILKSDTSQKALTYIQLSLFVLLLVQLIVTHTNIYVHYDPFKVAFNLVSANTTGYVLLALLLFSSVLIYRPFCRMVCPVGFILGWVTYLPGARKLQIKDTCVNCKSCSKACKQHALIHKHKATELRQKDCLLCGECIDHCKRSSLSVTKK
jgi:NAD-dependent dihydropyrimidine dehydrogenase PreA subunit